MLLAEKFQSIFLFAQNIEALCSNIEKQWINFKKGHSPQALGNIVDFKQAVYLGFTLGLIHLQNKLKLSTTKTLFFRKKEKNNPILLENINTLRQEVEASLLILIAPKEASSSQTEISVAVSAL